MATTAQLDREIATSIGKKRWNNRTVAQSHRVPEDVVRRIYSAVQLAKRQGLHAGYMVDLVEREVGRKLRGAEYTVAKLAKEHLGYALPSGYGGPVPKGAAAVPPRAPATSKTQDAGELAATGERLIKDVLKRTNAGMISDPSAQRDLNLAADELEVAADLYEEAGSKIRAGTLRERARLARSGDQGWLAVYHMNKKPPPRARRRR